MKNINELLAELNSWSRAYDFWTLRIVERRQESLKVRKGVMEPIRSFHDLGAMITVWSGSAYGYGATCAFTKDGLRQAFEQAALWAKNLEGRVIAPIDPEIFVKKSANYQYLGSNPWHQVPLKEKLERVQQVAEVLPIDSRIIDWSASVLSSRTKTSFYCSSGSTIKQDIAWIHPSLKVVAYDRGVTEQRTFGGEGICRQGGFEVLDEVGLDQAAQIVPSEAIELLSAPNCPDGSMDLLLAPDQMILQIHESIGHPLEIDRILGDERNYAGGSFIKPEMFGKYQYGSSLLNVTFDPSKQGEFASYQFDDEGFEASKVYLIKDGILKVGLGGAFSQARSGLEGVANSRAVNWNRPPIDRMANLNLEVGRSSLESMIQSIDRGVYMKTNSSWSIDDSRNKFQFGCEYGQMIEGGKLTHPVRKPNYRGISSSFWRNLSHVGNEETYEVLGTPYCGKGEPNQAISVGHASPACVFRQVQIFGGE